LEETLRSRMKFRTSKVGSTLLLAFVALSQAGATPRHAGARTPHGLITQEQAAPAQETFAAKDDTRPAEQVYKNIQILKGLPANQLVALMKSFTRALGVRCEHCHVTAPGSDIPGFGAFSKDDLEAKQTARKMLGMAGSIQRDFFDGKQGPTCWTCHRGSTKPELEPPLAAPPAKQ